MKTIFSKLDNGKQDLALCNSQKAKEKCASCLHGKCLYQKPRNVRQEQFLHLYTEIQGRDSRTMMWKCSPTLTMPHIQKKHGLYGTEHLSDSSPLCLCNEKVELLSSYSLTSNQKKEEDLLFPTNHEAISLRLHLTAKRIVAYLKCFFRRVFLGPCPVYKTYWQNMQYQKQKDRD